MALSESSESRANESLGGRVKINASKHLVRETIITLDDRGFDGVVLATQLSC